MFEACESQHRKVWGSLYVDYYQDDLLSDWYYGPTLQSSTEVVPVLHPCRYYRRGCTLACRRQDLVPLPVAAKGVAAQVGFAGNFLVVETSEGQHEDPIPRRGRRHTIGHVTQINVPRWPFIHGVCRATTQTHCMDIALDTMASCVRNSTLVSAPEAAAMMMEEEDVFAYARFNISWKTVTSLSLCREITLPQLDWGSPR